MKQWMLGGIAGLMVTLAASGAFALDLNQARSQGMVGEGRDGYVVAVQATPGAQSVAEEVNARRKAEYVRISGQNGQPVDVVGKLAFEQIVGRLPAGSLYQGDDGSWKKK